MDRRSFVMSLFGGLAAASLGGVAMAHAAPRRELDTAAANAGEIDTTMKAGLDKADADYSQVVVRERVVRRPPGYYRRRRPVVVRRTIVRRPRRVVVRRRVIYR